LGLRETIMMGLIRAGAMATLLLPAGACATITRGTTAAFVVESTPPGASVRTSTGFTCPSTPCTFKLPRNEEFEVTLRKQGYKPLSTRVLTEVAGGGAAGMAGNILFGGIIGAGVDVYSGAMNNLVPNPLRVVLEPETNNAGSMTAERQAISASTGASSK
jgi:PEGA domain